MALLTRRKESTAGEDAELLSARIERAEAFAEHAVAEEARLAANDLETMASHLDKLMAASVEFRTRTRLAEADRRLSAAADADMRRRREETEEELRPLCREEIELLERVEAIEAKKAAIAARAADRGVTIGEDWFFLPLIPETRAAESAFRTWVRWLSNRL